MAWKSIVTAALLSLSGPVAAAPRWSQVDLAALQNVVAAAPAEGLNGYDSVALAAARPGDVTDILADTIALKLARDLFEGSEAVRSEKSWHFDRGAPDYHAWLDDVLARHSVRSSFRALLPENPAYDALKQALPKCAPAIACARIALNLDRLRAMPRNLGSRYLWVNVPAFRLDLIDRGRIVASHRIIVGKPGSQTPSFQAKVTGVTINPWWNVPCSIVNESIGRLVTSNPGEAARQGFVASRDASGKLVVRQRPGPNNALGQVKLEMPNPYDVYIHDTPSKNLFANSRRAYSHGCIRTQDPQRLAASLLGPDQAPTIDLLLATGASRTIKVAQPIPVYVVYLTAEGQQDPAGTATFHPDIYRRDRL